jgi:hypothetical protein
MNDQVALVGAAAKEIVQQAQTLGLTWNLRIATVVSSSFASGLAIVFDGDTVTISATNMTGDILVGGDRVYVVMIPQSGNFVVGHAEVPSPVGLATARTAAQTLNTGAITQVDWDSASFDSSGFIGTFPSTSITIPTGLSGIYAVTAFVSMSNSGANNFIEVTATNLPNFIRARSTTAQSVLSVSGTVFLNGGDVLTTTAFQNSGVNGTMTNLGWIYRIG